jgi:glutamyl/glutaminyl-tRNA synthetase
MPAAIGNTRFNPTPTGDMHLGHAYLCFVNEYEAHSRGAKFYVRFDDTQRAWATMDSSPDEMRHFAERILDDLNWLGIRVDGAIYQSSEMPRVHRELENLFRYRRPKEPLQHSEYAITKTQIAYYPYAAALVPEKVWMDMKDIRCDHLIRGFDMITEFSLYCYWAEQFGLRQAEHVYLPRLTSVMQGDLSYGDGVLSKTHGKMTVREYREAGMSAAKMQHHLRQCCLGVPDAPWSVENVKRFPCVNGAFDTER